jgi:hypothetical protein
MCIVLKKMFKDVRGRGKVHTRFCWRTLWDRDHLEDLGIDGRIMFK